MKTQSSTRVMELQLQPIISKYRQLQLIEKQMNVTLRSFFIPGCLTFTTIGEIFTLFVCIKLHQEIPIQAFAFFPMLGLDLILVIGVDFASLGFIYLRSQEFVEGCKKLNGVKLVRRQTRSFPPLKIRFGMNFIDELTGMTILDFCLNQTVSLLLMT